MTSTKRLVDELTRMAGDAMGTLAGIRSEAETLFRSRIENLLGDMRLVTREEFDAVAEMAANARLEQERLAKRLARLEAKLGLAAKPESSPSATQKPSRKRAAKPKS
jgi:BMFP domain-containing protein YqiC